MIAYYVLLGCPILLSVFLQGRRKDLSKKIPLLLFFVIFVVLLSLRSVRTGTDLANYYVLYNYKNLDLSFSSLFDFSLVEPAYGLLEKVCYSFSKGDFQFFLIICALLALVPICILYYKESKNSILTVILFISIGPFSMFFSSLRESIALGLGAICFYFVKKKKILFFLLFVFLAFLFHQSAIVLLLMYPMYHMKIGKKFLPFIILVFLLVFAFKEQILLFIINNIGRLGEKYSEITQTGAYGYLVILLVLFIYCFYFPDEKRMDKNLFGLRNFLILSIILQSFASVHTLAMRFNYYFLIFIPLLIPETINQCDANKKELCRVSVPIICTVFLLYFFYSAYFGADIMRIFPYIPFWEN